MNNESYERLKADLQKTSVISQTFKDTILMMVQSAMKTAFDDGVKEGMKKEYRYHTNPLNPVMD